MQQRLDALKASPGAYKAMAGLQAYVDQTGLEKSLLELVKIRSSQINGCAFCLDMHSKDARKHGETEQRLYVLSGWHESPAFTPAERAALAWTEALTRVSETHAPDADYEPLRQHFSDKEIVDLTILIGMINLLNRLAVGMRYVHDVAAGAAAE